MLLWLAKTTLLILQEKNPSDLTEREDWVFKIYFLMEMVILSQVLLIYFMSSNNIFNIPYDFFSLLIFFMHSNTNFIIPYDFSFLLMTCLLKKYQLLLLEISE